MNILLYFVNTMKKFHINLSSDELYKKYVSMLFETLVGIVVILFIAFIHTMISLIFNFVQNGYTDWEHFGTIGKKSYDVMSINEYIHCHWYIIKGFVITYPIYFLLRNFWYMIKYNKFLNQFSVLKNVPTRDDIKELLRLVGVENMYKNVIINKILVPLMNQKIQCIENMSLLQKYLLVYTNNIGGIRIGTLRMYHIVPNDINNILLLNNVHVPNYISFEIISSKEKRGNILNENCYKGKDTLMLHMVFNQYAIIKDVILQVFLNDYENNDIKLIKNDVLLQIKLEDSYKKQLLISAIKENVSENLRFKEKFSEVLNNNYISKNIDNTKDII